jgi:pimeloyl-ACP methyl ester carboxylesterase
MGGAACSRLLGDHRHHHTIVRYDKHGCGLPDRNRSDFSLDPEVRAIEAIVKELGLKFFVLWGQGGGVPPQNSIDSENTGFSRRSARQMNFPAPP